jgi:hypothetical protein
MKVGKMIKKLFHNHTVLFVVVAAIVLMYFIHDYSSKKGLDTEGVVGSQISAGAFSDKGGAFPFNPPDVAATNKAGSASCCQGGGNYSPSGPLGHNESQASVSGINTNQHGLPPNCTSKQVVDPSQLLPKDTNGQFSQMNPMGAGDVKDVSLLRAGYHIGINTVGQSLRNANLQLRSEPANPQLQVGPWNSSTIGPDFNRRPLEIGCGPF